MKMSDLIDRDEAIMAVKMGALSAATLYGRTDEGSTALYETVRAIKAIPSVQPETHDKRTETHACDCISRQAAINAPVRMVSEGIEWIPVYHVEQLPSAQPEIIRCKDCKHHHYEGEDIPYCDRIDYGYGWKDNDYCSMAERRTDG